MTKKRGGTLEGVKTPLRDATGRRYYRVRLTLADGSRTRVEVPEAKRYSESASRNFADWAQEDEDTNHTIYNRIVAARAEAPVAARPGEETVRQWFTRFHEWCEDVDGQRNVRGRRSYFACHIDRGGFGDLAIAAPTELLRERVRGIVRYLDNQISIRAAFYRGEVERAKGGKPGMSPKTAANVWGELSGAFEAACTSKVDALRVRGPGQNPTTDVAAPDKGEDREQAALYPDEIVALLSCELVPLYRRELYAVALYSGARQSEIRGLVAGDIDFEHGTINVRRQKKKRGAGASRTKTRAGVRQIPIEPALEPLLRLLVGRASVEHARRLAADPNALPGPLVHVPPMEDCAEKLRDVDLRAAGCERQELYLDDEVRQHFTFHGLRHSCITHWAVAGLPLNQLMARSGHSDVETNQRYIDAGAILRGQRFGRPHPPLPPNLLLATEVSTEAGAPPKRLAHKGKKPTPSGSWLSSHGAVLATPAGIEPALPA